jgi:hypothetical protein
MVSGLKQRSGITMENTGLGLVLNIVAERWPREFAANDVAQLINDDQQYGPILREFFYPDDAEPGGIATPYSVFSCLKNLIGKSTKHGDITLVFCGYPKGRKRKWVFHIEKRGLNF